MSLPINLPIRLPVNLVIYLSVYMSHLTLVPYGYRNISDYRLVPRPGLPSMAMTR